MTPLASLSRAVLETTCYVRMCVCTYMYWSFKNGIVSGTHPMMLQNLLALRTGYHKLMASKAREQRLWWGVIFFHRHQLTNNYGYIGSKVRETGVCLSLVVNSALYSFDSSAKSIFWTLPPPT